MKEIINTIGKVFLAIIGATNLMFGIFMPIGLSLLLVTTYDLTPFSTNAVLIIGMLSSIFRAVRIAFIK